MGRTHPPAVHAVCLAVHTRGSDHRVQSETTRLGTWVQAMLALLKEKMCTTCGALMAMCGSLEYKKFSYLHVAHPG